MLGFQGAEFRVQSSEFRVQSSEFRVELTPQNLEFKIATKTPIHQSPQKMYNFW
jgi:hypothetical protein